MTFLLDTHVWIWTQEAPNRLGATTTKLLTNAQHNLYVSTISTLEIARLVSAGLVGLSGSLGSWISETIDSLLCGTVEVSHDIALGAYSLPGHFHKDPADRVLIATARIHEMTLVTADDRILAYRHVKSADARR